MHTPLADQIRPASLDDVVGQRQLLASGKPLRRIIESGKIPNMIFYGPSGVGKTTVARIIADSTSMTLHKLNGTSASTADIRDVVAEVGTFSGMNGILLYLDEIQYFNKKQQQLLLEYMENGQITLIASTTENPYFAVCTMRSSAVLPCSSSSRSRRRRWSVPWHVGSAAWRSNWAKKSTCQTASAAGSPVAAAAMSAKP